MKSRIYITGLCLLFVTLLSGQSDLLLYQFSSIGQSQLVNPASPQDNKLWVGIGSPSFRYFNNSFSAKDFIGKGTNVNANLKQIVEGVRPGSGMQVDTRVLLLGTSVATNAGDFSLALSQRSNTRIDFDEDLFGLVYYGNAFGEQRDVSFEKMNIESIAFVELGLGYRKTIDRGGISFGGSLKLLKGQVHGYISENNARLQTTPTSALIADANVEARTSGIASLIDGSSDIEILPEGNFGLALDVGFYTELNADLSVSVSLLDFGFINWTNDTRNYRLTGVAEYEGLILNLPNDAFTIDGQEEALDTLASAFRLDEIDGPSYTRSLAPRLLFGGRYNLKDRQSVVATVSSRYWGKRLYTSAMLGYTYKITGTLEATGSYTLAARSLGALGLGLSLRAGPVQVFALAENLPHLVAYENARQLSFDAGLNIALQNKLGSRYLKQKVKSQLQKMK